MDQLRLLKLLIAERLLVLNRSSCYSASNSHFPMAPYLPPLSSVFTNSFKESQNLEKKNLQVFTEAITFIWNHSLRPHLFFFEVKLEHVPYFIFFHITLILYSSNAWTWHQQSHRIKWWPQNPYLLIPKANTSNYFTVLPQYFKW